MNQFIKLFHFELFLRFLRATKEEKRLIKEKEMNKKNPSRKIEKRRYTKKAPKGCFVSYGRIVLLIRRLIYVLSTPRKE